MGNRIDAVPLNVKLTLTVREAAAYMNLPERYVYGLVRSGELPCIRTGDNGAWHVARSAAERWVEQHAELPARAPCRPRGGCVMPAAALAGREG